MWILLGKCLGSLGGHGEPSDKKERWVEASRRPSKEGRTTWIRFAWTVLLWESCASRGRVCMSGLTVLSLSEEKGSPVQTLLWHLKVTEPVPEMLQILTDSHFASQFALSSCGRQCGAVVRSRALEPHGQGSDPNSVPPIGGIPLPGQVTCLCCASVSSSVEWTWTWDREDA